MKQLEFNFLDISQQVDLLYVDGVFLGKRKCGIYSVLLYQLEGFYIEIYYLKHRQHISRICSSSSTNMLDPYLEEVDIEELINC